MPPKALMKLLPIAHPASSISPIVLPEWSIDPTQRSDEQSHQRYFLDGERYMFSVVASIHVYLKCQPLVHTREYLDDFNCPLSDTKREEWTQGNRFQITSFYMGTLFKLSMMGKSNTPELAKREVMGQWLDPLRSKLQSKYVSLMEVAGMTPEIGEDWVQGIENVDAQHEV